MFIDDDKVCCLLLCGHGVSQIQLCDFVCLGFTSCVLQSVCFQIFQAGENTTDCVPCFPVFMKFLNLNIGSKNIV